MKWAEVKLWWGMIWDIAIILIEVGAIIMATVAANSGNWAKASVYILAAIYVVMLQNQRKIWRAFDES